MHTKSYPTLTGTPRLLALASSSALILAGTTFGACGGSESTTDGGGESGIGDDSGYGDQQNPPFDSGDPDTQPADTGTPDTGPVCTNTPCVVGLAVGGHHACALIVDGTVRCWGANLRGQLGAGGDAGATFNGQSHAIPVQVENIANATQVAASTVYGTFGSTCVRVQGGEILCFGSNGAGQLGLLPEAGVVDQNAHPFAAAVQGLPTGTGPSLGNFHGCAVVGTDLWCWGDNGIYSGGGGLLGRGPNPNTAGPAGKATWLADAGASVVQGFAGSDFTLALGQNGTVYSWGANGSGELGRPTNNGNDDPNPAPIGNVSNAAQVSAGAQHACAVTQAGQIFCWGDNGWGQLGRSLQGGSSNNPAAVALPNAKTAKQVSCSNNDTCALATDGTVYCWGRNVSGQVGWNAPDAATFNQQPATSPIEVLGLTGKALYVGTGGTTLQNISTGYACALIEGGSVQCWGSNSDQQLGRGPAVIPTCPNNGGQCSPVPGAVVWQ